MTDTDEFVQEPQGTEDATTEQTTDQDTGSQQAEETVDQEPQGASDDTADELATWKAHARKHEDRAKALAAENATLKQQLEDAKAAASEAASKLTRAEIAAEVAASKGVKIRYLTGDTREELEASAEAFLEDARAAARVGVVPTQGTGGTAPRVTSFASGAERARAQQTKTKEGR